ncbi:MAG: DUF4332 domain-containing protein [Planctomycetota bacterium]
MRWKLHSNAGDVLALGPRTAGRLASVGIRTVADLLSASAHVVATRLRNFDADQITTWQREASLLVAIPDLSDEAARLLATADCGCVETLAASTPTELFAKLEAARQTTEDRWLVEALMPTIATVSAWIQLARESKKSRAA